jgi:hypothetical protein
VCAGMKCVLARVARAIGLLPICIARVFAHIKLHVSFVAQGAKCFSSVFVTVVVLALQYADCGGAHLLF